MYCLSYHFKITCLWKHTTQPHFQKTCAFQLCSIEISWVTLDTHWYVIIVRSHEFEKLVEIHSGVVYGNVCHAYFNFIYIYKDVINTKGYAYSKLENMINNNDIDLSTVIMDKKKYVRKFEEMFQNRVRETWLNINKNYLGQPQKSLNFSS